MLSIKKRDRHQLVRWPGAKGQKLYDFVPTRSLETVGRGNLGQARRGKEFQFGKLKRLWEGQ